MMIGAMPFVYFNDIPHNRKFLHEDQIRVGGSENLLFLFSRRSNILLCVLNAADQVSFSFPLSNFLFHIKFHINCFALGNTGGAEGGVQAVVHAVSPRQTPGPGTKAPSRAAF